MKPVEGGLQKLDGYLYLIRRDAINGWYEIEVGLPPKWIFKGNNVIECEVINKTELGTLVKIKPVVENVQVDDLISFTELIIETNMRIVAREQEFIDKITTVKDQLNAEKDVFYKELEDLKEKSFSIFNNITGPTPAGPVKRGRGRPKGTTKKKPTTPKTTSEKKEEVVENDEKVQQ